jgi:hypothetical protein
VNIAGFNEARLAAQYETYGEPAVIGGLSCVVCASAHRAKSALEEGGLGIEFARSVRCRIADFAEPLKAGKKAIIGGVAYRVADVMRMDRAGEYLLGLEQMR